jgi:HEAT repeat protein
MPTFWSMRCCNRSRLEATLAALLVLLLLAQVVSAVIVVSSPIFHSSLGVATEAAASDQSLVMIVFGADWCVPCRQLKAKTLDSPEFMEQGGALHVVEVDVDSEETMARDYNVEAVPTLVLLTSENKIVARREGFLQTAELLLWLREARERVKEGKWEGTAPSSKLAEFVVKAAADQLETNDLMRLVEMIGEPNPADRDTAAKLLIEQRDTAVILLIEAVTNSYLGVRIGAAEALHKLAPEAPSLDPWQTPAELVETAAALKKWWAATGKLPIQHEEPRVEQVGASSITSALDSLRGSDPVQRTRAMSTLVAGGTGALPAVRQAIKLSEKTGDQRSLTLLEDVRWAILIPDVVDQRAGGVRSVLARGKGSERQTAATRLSRAGRGAIPALSELLEDSDPMVVESAVRALSSIGGKDAIPAMTALLKAEDSNLRMTAAQALGHTKNAAAVKELLTVFGDPNEVVACAALSALDEINGDRDYSPSKKAQPPEVVQALKRCLGEPRWRVRAAAAEVTGKLGVKELITELNTLLSETDGFVVKNALEALQTLGAAPEPQKLLAVAQRQPGLREQTVEMLVKWGTEDSVKTITELYNSSSADGQIAIVRSLGAGSERGQETSLWQPLLAQATMETDPRVRRAAAESLAAQPPKVAAALVGTLLSDEDTDTRVSAAGVVLSVIAGERQIVASSHGSFVSGFVSMDDAENSFGASRKKANPTNEPPVTPVQISTWHTALQQKAGTNRDLLTAAAIYVSGSSNTDLPVLEHALEHSDRASLARLGQSAAVAAILPRLPWPDGKGVIERFSVSPTLFLTMTAYAQKAAPGLSDFLLDPTRFRAAVDPASPDELQASLPRLLGPQQKEWSLLSNTPRTEAVVKALLGATNAGWRAAAVYSLSLRDDPQGQAYFEHALSDSNRWVRVAAASGLARAIKDRTSLERVLAPLLSDPDKKVAEIAATGLLEPETRSAAGLNYGSSYFEFEKVHVWASSYEPSGEQRPLATVPGNPPFLQSVRQKLANNTTEDAAPTVLILAQYGDFTGLDQLLKEIATENQKEDQLEGVVLTAIGLSRDPKYMPYVKKMLTSAKEEQDFRRLLQALRGISGAEARELRLEINKRMRQGRE